jgi:hypothetical protein
MRKRSSYRPRACGLPLVFGLTEEMRNDLQLMPMLQLDAFREGRGNEDGAYTVAGAVNVAAVLSRTQHADIQAFMSKGLDAVQGVFERAATSGRWGVSGDEYQAISAALRLGAELADACPRRTVAAAIKTVFQEAGR